MLLQPMVMRGCHRWFWMRRPQSVGLVFPTKTYQMDGGGKSSMRFLRPRSNVEFLFMLHMPRDSGAGCVLRLSPTAVLSHHNYVACFTTAHLLFKASYWQISLYEAPVDSQKWAR